MRKFLSVVFVGLFMTLSGGARANVLATDTSDPLHLLAIEEVLSQSSIAYWDHILRAGQSFSYGINNRLTLGANVHYQHDFNGNEDGFSAIDLGGVYRMGRAEDSESGIIYDVLFGFKFGGSKEVRTPWYADSTYYAGLRMGRQWAGLTLAATIKSSWIFNDERGMSYIDMMPEAYFRIAPDWRLGGSFTLRKATNPKYNQEWLGAKLVRQYGRTQYIGHMDFEFESKDLQVGARINILF